MATQTEKLASAFDRFAAGYDEAWTHLPAGRLQRQAVWRNIADYFYPDHCVLDLGCGTGEDALWLSAAGVHVTAIDSSPEMVAIASRRGVDARCLPIEDLGQLPGTFDGALSDFGPWNCIESPAALRSGLARKIRPGGHLAVCVMGRFCLWETLAYLVRGHFRKAMRRWNGSARAETLGIRVTYPTVQNLRHALAPDFRLIRTVGIGILVPPSFIRAVPAPLLSVMGMIDNLIERLPGVRALSDHRLLIFVRQ